MGAHNSYQLKITFYAFFFFFSNTLPALNFLVAMLIKDKKKEAQLILILYFI